MAIYYFNASVIKRSGGRSATASAAYRAAERIKDERTGEIHDYRKKKGVDEKIILAPNSAPDWVYDRAKLWNVVEQLEKRKDSQVAREIKLAIPGELNRRQQVELVKEFVEDQFVSKGMVADICLHELSSHNPHAHIMLTMREIDETGFNKKKNRDWNKTELLAKQREAWSTYANIALKLAGIDSKIDHRTLEEQGINRIPQIHLGSAAAAMMKRGVATYKGDRYREISEANKQIESLERSLAKVESQVHRLEKAVLACDRLPRSEITADKKLTTSKGSSQVSEVRVSGIGSSIRLNFDEEETNLNLPQVPSYKGRNPRQPQKGADERSRTEYENSRLLIHQELGNDIGDPRLDLEIYLRANSQSEIIKQSAVYQRLENKDPKIARCYLKAIASSAQTYKNLCNQKIPDLDKWAKKLINSQSAKFYARENNRGRNIEKQQKRGRGLSL